MARDTAPKTAPGLRVRLALGLLSALVLLADGTGSGQLLHAGGVGQARDRDRATQSGEVDRGGQASRLDGIIGVAVSVPGQRFEKAGPSDPPSPSRGRAKEWTWTTSRLHAEVRSVIQQFRLSAWRQRHGHLSDRPLISTLPARGPPAPA